MCISLFSKGGGIKTPDGGGGSSKDDPSSGDVTITYSKVNVGFIEYPVIDAGDGIEMPTGAKVEFICEKAYSIQNTVRIRYYDTSGNDAIGALSFTKGTDTSTYVSYTENSVPNKTVTKMRVEVSKSGNTLTYDEVKELGCMPETIKVTIGDKTKTYKVKESA